MQGDLLRVARDCVVSPANSYGFMGEGIDDAYRNFFGAAIEQTVRDAILRRPEASLPVGASLVVRTGHSRVPYLRVAPTMTMPEPVESTNSYRAMRAMLRVVHTIPQDDINIFCPGLATGVGQVPLPRPPKPWPRPTGIGRRAGSGECRVSSEESINRFDRIPTA